MVNDRHTCAQLLTGLPARHDIGNGAGDARSDAALAAATTQDTPGSKHQAVDAGMQAGEVYDEEGDVDRAEEGDEVTETEGEDEGVPSPEGDTATTALAAAHHAAKVSQVLASRARPAGNTNGHGIERKSLVGRRPQKKKCFQLYKKAISEMEKEDLLEYVTTNRPQIDESVIEVTSEGSNVITSTHIHVEYHAGNDIRIFVPWDAISTDFHGVPNKEFWFSFQRVEGVPRLTVRRNTIRVPGQQSMRLTPIPTAGRPFNPALGEPPPLPPPPTYPPAAHLTSTSYLKPPSGLHYSSAAAHDPASGPSSSRPPPSASDPPHVAHKKARLLSESYPPGYPPGPGPLPSRPTRTTPLTAHPGPAGAESLQEWLKLIDGIFKLLAGRKDTVLARWRKWIMDTPQPDIIAWYNAVNTMIQASGDPTAQAATAAQVADAHDADLVAGGADGDVWRLRLQVVQRLDRAVKRGSFEPTQKAALQRRAFTTPAAKIAQCREVVDAKEDTQTDWYFIWILKE